MTGSLSRGAGVCHYCDAEATLLCDGILGWRRVWYQRPEHAKRFDPRFKADGWWCVDTSRDGEEMVTCDRPMCDGCAHRAGTWFFGGTGPEAGIESIDLCRDCKPSPSFAPLLDDETLDALRARRQLRRLP